ncbi:MAG: hypothetical protein NWF13_07775 [Candidatus Bathyarchaeota archaeon]|nr:hypothetical protein [Candidatus Bathyarchaeota archaeon]
MRTIEDELDDEEGFEDWLYGNNIDKRSVGIEKTIIKRWEEK